MLVMHKCVIWTVLFAMSIALPPDVFNVNLTMPNIHTTNDAFFYATYAVPDDEELYIVGFNPIVDNHNARHIATYACSNIIISTAEKFWTGEQPCDLTDELVILHDWFYNSPVMQWPQDVGFPIGKNTFHRYLVVKIRYLSSVENDTSGQQFIISRQRPKYQSGFLLTGTDSIHPTRKTGGYRADFSCQYSSSPIHIFAAKIFAGIGGRAISMYRVRNDQVQLIIKGNANWPQTFYTLPNPIDIQSDDYLIGHCVYVNDPSISTTIPDDTPCIVLIIFWMEQNLQLPSEPCWDNDLPRIMTKFLPIDADFPPETLFDINPIYPKLTPNDLANTSLTSIERISGQNRDTILLSLSYSNAGRHQAMIHLLRTHRTRVILIVWTVALLIGFILLAIILIRSYRQKKRPSSNSSKLSKSIAVGGDTSSLSRWLTRQRYQQYDTTSGDSETKPLNSRRWTSSDDETNLSDEDFYDTSGYQHVILKK